MYSFIYSSGVGLHVKFLNSSSGANVKRMGLAHTVCSYTGDPGGPYYPIQHHIKLLSIKLGL